MRNSGLPCRSESPSRSLLPVAACLLGAGALLSLSCSSSSKTSWEPVPADPELTGPVAEPAAEPGAAPAAQDGGVDEALRQDAEALSLKEQRRAFLVEQHLANARRFREALRLEDARSELLAANALDSDDLEVKRMLSEVRALLGESVGEVTTVTEELANRYELMTQQLKAEAADSLRNGKVALARGDYDAAIAELTICLNHIRWAPYSIDWEGIDAESQSLLERAKSDRVAAEEARMLAQQRKAYEELQSYEEVQRERERSQVDNMLEQAVDSFDRGEYEDAIHYAEQALRRDPHNEMAEELRTSAFKAGRQQASEEYVEAKREQFQRWQEQLEEMRIPWTEPVTLPDADRWRQITKLRSQRRGIDLSSHVSAGEAALREQLRTTAIKLPPVEQEESLAAVVDLIRVITGLPLVVDPAAEDAVINEGKLFDFSFENDLTVEQALNLIAEMAGEEVTWTIKHDAVLLTTGEKARGEPMVVHHSVQDLVFGLTDFMGPRIDRIRLLDELEDDDGGGPFGGIGERPQLINIDDLATMIQENVAVGLWDDGATIESYEGHIIVVAPAEVQAEVRDFLEDLRRFSSSLVTIESKFMTVGDNWIQEIGVDFRGLDATTLTDVSNGLEDQSSLGLDNGGTGSAGQNAAGAPAAGFFYDDGGDGDFRGRTENFFGNPLGSSLSTVGGLSFQLTFLNDIELSAILTAVEKTSQFELINDQVLSVHNTQRAYVTVINQQAYIQDFDVEVAQFQAVADPQVNVLTEGVVLDVRPTISHNRKYLTLEVQPTVAKVTALRNFSSTLGGNTSPVEFQLPELEVQSVFTTAVIPDGGSILLGGLSNIRNIERRAEVPWLAQIPIVGFFFKREGYSDENETLMILIRARITDVREEVSRIEASY